MEADPAAPGLPDRPAPHAAKSDRSAAPKRVAVGIRLSSALHPIF
jgi:hypothetical protein